MAERIWINRVSNLVCRIVGLYWAACGGSITTIALWIALWSTAAFGGSGPLVCVLVPHFVDEYWLSVGYGLEQEAARQDIDLLFFEAGGYRARARQIQQLGSCVERGSDSILIGAVTSDHPDLIEAIAKVAETMPVFGLVNELHSQSLSARIGVDWRDMGDGIGQYLSGLHPKGTPPKTAILVSGPAESGWPAPLEAGLRAGLAESAVTIVDVSGADTGLRRQLALVETALETHPGADYLIGSAPAIEAAMGLLAASDAQSSPRLLSTYVSHTVLRGLMNGSVLAAPFDDPMLQGIMAIRQTLKPKDPADLAPSVGPRIRLVPGADSNFEHIQISPPDYFPAIQ